jgi:UDP-glucose:(heptosyl)LPS alpha-1,3-glucosyltransferase
VADDDLLVLSVAHNFRLKGVAQWMEALALLMARGQRKIRSLIVGRGESAVWARMASRLGVARAVTFVGPSDRVRAFYHAADVLVHPTYYDPCSRVVLEGMVSGLPVITTRWDGSSEMIREGENGFVLDDPADTPGLARRVEKLQDDALRRQVGSNAGQVADQISMARHAREVLALYERIANGHGVAG